MTPASAVTCLLRWFKYVSVAVLGLLASESFNISPVVLFDQFSSGTLAIAYTRPVSTLKWRYKLYRAETWSNSNGSVF